MQRTRVKICGVTRVVDAIAAVQAGADAIGMVFDEESARNVKAQTADAIIAALPPFVTPVAVFVDTDPREMVMRAASHGITTIQLNGFRVVPIADLFPMRVIQAVHLNASSRDQLNLMRGFMPDNLIGLVVDTAVPGQPGGTGVANDWDLLEQLLREGAFTGMPPMIAAGGLNSENVADVIRRFGPWAVDVSSGVEVSRGIKSPELIERFCRAANPERYGSPGQ